MPYRLGYQKECNETGDSLKWHLPPLRLSFSPFSNDILSWLSGALYRKASNLCHVSYKGKPS